MKQLSKQNKAAIAEFLSKWKKKLNLAEWQGRVEFGEEFDDPCVFAEIHIDWTYLSFTILINEPMTIEHIEDGRVKDIKYYLVHELVHLLIDPMYILAEDAQSNQTRPCLNRVREQTVERITRLLVKA